jgi:hypothetical protein
MQDFIAALVSFFLIEPLQAEMADKLAAARAPQAIVTDVASCARTATPLILARATSEPWWAASTAFGLWIGTTRPEGLLVEAAPGCAGAVQAARPFLRENDA